MLDIPDYFRKIIAANRLANEQRFFFTTYTASRDIEGVLANHRKEAAIFAVSDFTESRTYQAPGGAWFNRRIISAFIIKRYRPKDIADQITQMDICRELLRQIHSKLIHDQTSGYLPLARMETGLLSYRELGANFLDSSTGLQFQIAIDEPIDLCYTPTEWD